MGGTPDSSRERPHAAVRVIAHRSSSFQYRVRRLLLRREPAAELARGVEAPSGSLTAWPAKAPPKTFARSPARTLTWLRVIVQVANDGPPLACVLARGSVRCRAQ